MGIVPLEMGIQSLNMGIHEIEVGIQPLKMGIKAMMWAYSLLCGHTTQLKLPYFVEKFIKNTFKHKKWTRTIAKSTKNLSFCIGFSP
jgi:hypothetical protein